MVQFTSKELPQTQTWLELMEEIVEFQKMKSSLARLNKAVHIYNHFFKSDDTSKVEALASDRKSEYGVKTARKSVLYQSTIYKKRDDTSKSQKLVLEEDKSDDEGEGEHHGDLSGGEGDEGDEADGQDAHKMKEDVISAECRKEVQLPNRRHRAGGFVIYAPHEIAQGR